MNLKEIAGQIDAHLKRMEADPKINTTYGSGDQKVHRYYMAGASVGGRYVSVRYISYQGSSHLTKERALRYLEALNSGYVGAHWNIPVTEEEKS